MIAIPLKVLVSMGGLAVDCSREGMVCLGCDQCIQEGNNIIVLVTFDSELYCWINVVHMIQKYMFIGLLLNGPCVIHIPEPVPRGVGEDCSASLSNSSLYKLATLDLPGNPLGLLQPVHKIYFGKKSKYCTDRTLKVQ